MTELQKRIATALVLIPVVLYLIFFLENQHFKIAISVVLVLGAWEWCRLVGIKALSAQVVYILLLLVLAYAIHRQFIASIYLYLFATLWWFCALFLVTTYPKSDVLWRNNLLLKCLIGIAILVPTWAGVVALQAESPWKMLFVFVLVWAADIGAYFVGKRFGKHKLALKVSPGKSIEGLLGGLALALVVGLVLKNHVGLETLSIFNALFIFSLVVLFSILGDLSESLFKRSSGVKDSSQLLPGHGGILDRIDSLTAAVPIYFASMLLFA